VACEPLDPSAVIGLWDELPSDDPYVEQPPPEALVLSIEEQLGYVLPSAYKELARLRNGGILRRNAHASPRPTTWAADHVAVTGIFAVGRRARFSLCGELGQALWLDEWGYPRLGVYFADTPLISRQASNRAASPRDRSAHAAEGATAAPHRAKDAARRRHWDDGLAV